MNYTIINTKDYQTGQEMSIEKVGNMYMLYFTNGDKLFTKTFKYFNTVLNVYQELTYYFIRGYHSFEERCKIIEEAEEDSND